MVVLVDVVQHSEAIIRTKPQLPIRSKHWLTQGLAIFGLNVRLPLQLFVNRGADQRAVFAVDGLKVILYLRRENQGKGRRLGHDKIIDVQFRKVNPPMSSVIALRYSSRIYLALSACSYR